MSIRAPYPPITGTWAHTQGFERGGPAEVRDGRISGAGKPVTFANPGRQAGYFRGWSLSPWKICVRVRVTCFLRWRGSTVALMVDAMEADTWFEGVGEG